MSVRHLLLVSALLGGCGACREEPDPAPVPPAPSPSAPPEPAPSLSVTVPPPLPPPPSWKDVGDLEDIVGRWGAAPDEEGVAVDFFPKKDPGDLYPYYLSVSADEQIDCGVFTALQEGDPSWRVGYCQGGPVGSKRRAEKVALLTMQDTLRIVILGSYELRVARNE